MGWRKASAFQTSSDGHGGTVVTYTAPPAPQTFLAAASSES